MFRRVRYVSAASVLKGEVEAGAQSRYAAFIGPVVLMFAMGYGITFDVENLKYAVFDQDQTPIPAIDRASYCLKPR